MSRFMERASISVSRRSYESGPPCGPDHDIRSSSEDIQLCGRVHSVIGLSRMATFDRGMAGKPFYCLAVARSSVLSEFHEYTDTTRIYLW